MESIWNEYLWLVTMSLIYIFQMWVGSSKEWGGRFQKGWAWFMAFDMGVLGPTFWVLHLTHWQVLMPVGWDWGAYLGLLRGRPCPGLPLVVFLWFYLCRFPGVHGAGGAC